MSLRSLVRAAVVAGVLLAPALPAGAVTTEQFRLRTGADLVALCATPTDDPLYQAAIHFCHGFGSGVYQTMMALTTHEKLVPVLCPTNPPPTRNEGLAKFLAWSSQHQEQQQEPPAEFLGRFLLEQFPCPKTAKPAAKKAAAK
jgi:hypothetical protein